MPKKIEKPEKKEKSGKEEGINRKATIHTRVTPDIKDMVAERASSMGLDVSEYVRILIVNDIFGFGITKKPDSK